MLGQFCVGLMLDEGPAPGSSGENVADQMQHFVPRPNRHSFFSGRVRCNGTDRCGCRGPPCALGAPGGSSARACASTACCRVSTALCLVVQLIPCRVCVCRWHRFEYNVTCPRGFRRALVLLRGRRAHDPNAPALPPPVYCGAKFAAAELVFE